MNRYEWIWEGKTPKGSCEWYSIDGLESGTEWTQALENDIIERTKATYYSTVVGEFVKICAEQGITVNLVSVDVYCEIVKDALEVQRYGARPTKIVWIQRFYVKVKGTVIFESEQELVGSPIAVPLLIALGKVIASVILAIGVAWAIYEFLRNLTLNETSSKIHIIKYDPETGNVIEETWEHITKKEPSWEAWIGIIVIVIVVFLFLLVLPQYLPKKERR